MQPSPGALTSIPSVNLRQVPALPASSSVNLEVRNKSSGKQGPESEEYLRTGMVGRNS